jgi:hypothetical protein
MIYAGDKAYVYVATYITLDILNKYRMMLFKLVTLRIFKIMNVKIAYSRLYGLWFTPLHVSLKKTWSLHAAVARQ